MIMAYSPLLRSYLPQMGMLGGMYGGGAAGIPGGAQMPGMPMANAAPQLPTMGNPTGGAAPYAPNMAGPTPPSGATGASPMGSLADLVKNPALMAQLKGLSGYLRGGGTDANPGMMGMLGSLFGGNPGNAGYSGLLGGSGLTQGGLGNTSFADLLASGRIPM